MLLNKYVRTLGRTEDFARLLFDEDFDGADAVSPSSYIPTVLIQHGIG